MSICQQCSRIPFHDLPTVKSGYLYQPTLEALEQSSLCCPLCKLIHSEWLKSLYHFNPTDDTLRHQEYIADLLRDKGLPRSAVRVRGRRDGKGLIRFWVDLIGTFIAIGTYEDEPLASKFIRRPVAAHPAHPLAIHQARQWVEDCNMHHEYCTPPTILKADYSQTPLPTRVLDVGTLQTPGVIRLLEPKGRCGSYLTLSHCWGRLLPLTTTSKTLLVRKEGICSSLLPKTFLDAVSVTRQMGIQYIWIDALCIIQDDFNDWEREASKMASIYANSYLTIAASTAQDGSIGMLNPRSKSDTVQMKYEYNGNQNCRLFMYPEPLVASPSTHGDDWLESEPLNHRAWTLQERYLSTRILHYANSQMFYECQKHVIAENGESGRPVYRNQIFHRFNGWEKDEIMEWIYREWTDILTEYSARNLTRGSDKLPALSGLATLFAKGSKDRYCAGLWWRDLRRGLLWRVECSKRGQTIEQGKRTRYDEFIAPSWSPLSITTSIEYPLVETLSEWGEQLILPLEYHAAMAGENQFGAIKEDTWLRVRAPLLPLFLVPGHSIPTHEDDEWIETSTHLGIGAIEGKAYLDSSTKASTSTSLFAFILKKPVRSSLVQMVSYSWHGLVIQPTGRFDGEYQRIGLVDASPESYSGKDDVDMAILSSTFTEFKLV